VLTCHPFVIGRASRIMRLAPPGRAADPQMEREPVLEPGPTTVPERSR
jgi:hypothetical protein